jgi:hypothetical protein
MLKYRQGIEIIAAATSTASKIISALILEGLHQR